MKAETYSLSVEARLILSGRELELLNHICSYENKEFIRNMVSTHYSHGVTEKDLVDFFQKLRETTGNLIQIIQSANKEAFDPFRTK